MNSSKGFASAVEGRAELSKKTLGSVLAASSGFVSGCGFHMEKILQPEIGGSGIEAEGVRKVGRTVRPFFRDSGSIPGDTGPSYRIRKAPITAIPPLVIMALIFCLHFKLLTPWFVYNPPLLIPVLNVLFLSVVSFSISHIAAKSYMASGKPMLVFLGCGALAVGFASMAAGWSMGSIDGHNLSLTIHNTGFFMGGVFHFAGAVLTFLEIGEEPKTELRRRNLITAYSGVFLLILLFIFWSLQGAPSPYYHPLSGHTLFRQMTLGSGLVLFSMSSLFFLAASYRLRAMFLYWYALGLGLIASGLLAFFFARVVGSPITWAGRIAEYAGGIYLLMAVSQVVITARSRNVPLERIVTGLLQKSRALYVSLVGATTDAIISLDQGGRVLLWNPAAEKMFKYCSNEVLGLNAIDLIIPEQNAEPLIDALKGRLSHAISRMEVDAGTKGGESLSLEVSASITKAGGEYVTTLIMRDIRDRKHAERSLQESEKKYRTLFETMSEGFALGELVTDEHGQADDFRILEANPAFWRLTGILPENSVGKTGRELVPNLRSHWVEILGKVALSGSPLSFQDLSKENGKWLDFFAFSPEKGRVAVLFIDITERKKVEQEMRRTMEALSLERSLLNAVLEQMPAGVVIAEAGSGRLILGNRKAETLWVEGFREDRGFHPNGRRYDHEEWPLMRSLQKGEVVLHDEIGFLRSDGTTGICSANSAPIYDDQDKIIAGVLTFHDITARKAMEDELRRSRHALELRVKERTAELEMKNKELQDFAFIASHDLQEPLRKIQTFGDMLVRKFEHVADEESRDYIRRMQRGAARMEALLSSLLIYSRAGTKAQCISQIDLNESAREAVSNLEIRLRETGGSVEIDSLPNIEADSSQITQVFQNLIGNALKFHKPDSKPLVRIYSRISETAGNEAYEICVEDNGIGFDEKYLNRLFLPFQRLHGRSEYEGVGMGLAVCKKILERHCGTITARSIVGKGSTFVFRLPRGNVMAPG